MLRFFNEIFFYRNSCIIKNLYENCHQFCCKCHGKSSLCSLFLRVTSHSMCGILSSCKNGKEDKKKYDEKEKTQIAHKCFFSCQQLLSAETTYIWALLQSSNYLLIFQFSLPLSRKAYEKSAISQTREMFNIFSIYDVSVIYFSSSNNMRHFKTYSHKLIIIDVRLDCNFFLKYLRFFFFVCLAFYFILFFLLTSLHLLYFLSIHILKWRCVYIQIVDQT